MRLVTSAGVCDEVAEREYLATEATRLINTPGLSGGEKHQLVKPCNKRVIWAKFRYSYDLFFPVGANLVEYMKKTGFHQFPKRPEQKSPFETTFNVGFFEFFAENEDQRRYFDDYMAIRREGLSSWHEVFPMASHLGSGVSRDDQNAVLLVDVGGNWGHELRSFHQAHPEVPGRLILQDLPVMIDKFEGKPPPGIEVMTYDFFTPQPIKGGHEGHFLQLIEV